MYWTNARNILFLFISLAHYSDTALLTESKKLFDALTKNYNAKLRPVKHDSTSVEVRVSFNTIGIVNFDEIAQSFAVSGWFDVLWQDELLSWNASDYGGISKLVLDQNDVWKPDITLMNFHEEMNSFTEDFVRLEVYRDGTVAWYPGNVYKTTCKLDISYFPFDSQMCRLVVGSWTYTTYEINLQALTSSIGLHKYQTNGEWEIIKTDVVKSQVGESSTILEFKLYIKRRPLFFVINTILPVVILSYLNILVFKVPTEAGERLSYSITVLLAFAVFMSFITSSIPKNGEKVSILAVFLSILILCSSVIVALTAVSLRLYYRTDSVPKRLQRIYLWWNRLKICQKPQKGSSKREDGLRFDNPNKKKEVRFKDVDDVSWKTFCAFLDSVFFWVLLVFLTVIIMGFLLSIGT